jgi:hypothetical protein
MNITLADGKEYDVKPLTLGALERLQPLIKKVYGENDEIDITNSNIFGDIISICAEILKVTTDQAKELVDIKNIKEVFVAGFGAEENKKVQE